MYELKFNKNTLKKKKKKKKCHALFVNDAGVPTVRDATG